MKKLIFSIFVLLLVNVSFAQKTARAAADELIKIYNLDADQAATMLEIQERKLKNLAEIADLESSNLKMYRHKRKAIYQSTDASIRRMLNESQMEIYKKMQNEKRLKEAAISAKLKSEGKTPEEIENALQEMEQ